MISLKIHSNNLKVKIFQNASRVKKLAKEMESFKAQGSDYLGWKDWALKDHKALISDIKNTINYLKKLSVNTLVVVGIGGSYIGARAAIEMINGLYPNNLDMEVIFFGESLSSTQLAQKLKYLENKNFAINVISKSGTTIETSLSFRLVRTLLEKKVGYHNSCQYIIATTDANKGSLLTLSKEKGYKTFVIPDDIGGRFSVLTAVGLLPMAFAGLNISEVLLGAKQASEKYSDSNIEHNIAYQYALARYLLLEKYPIELMVQFENQMLTFSEWWKQLSAESEGKNESGIFPASCLFSTDLHSLGQFIQQGSKVLFETFMFCQNPLYDLQIPYDDRNIDNLNKYKEITFHNINATIQQAAIDAHKLAGVEIIEILYKDFSALTFGHLVIFFQRAIAMSSYLLNINPFNQPGVEVYKQNMFQQLDLIVLKNKS